MKQSFLLGFCLLCAWMHVCAQSAFVYTPMQDDQQRLGMVRKAIRDQFVKDSLSFTGTNKKQFREIYFSRYAYLNELLNNKEIVALDEVEKYFQVILDEIYRGNPAVAQLHPRFLLSKINIPNAASYGEGTIIFNIDLFIKLKSEAQVAFVICHELAHYYLNHGNASIAQYVNTVYSDEFQQKLRELKRTEYEKNRELAKLAKGIEFNSRRHGREHENEADSIGLQFLKNTRYDVHEALSVLAILEHIDEEAFPTENTLTRLFDATEYHFKSKWIKKEEAFFGGAKETVVNEKEKDSLKTHPDCAKRILNLTPDIEMIRQVQPKMFLGAETDFQHWQEQFRFLQLQFYTDSKMLSIGLFLALKLWKDYPENPYLVKTIGSLFNQMYQFQKNHQLNLHADISSPYHETSYNDLLKFLERLSLKDIVSINYYFLKKYEAPLKGDVHFIAIFTSSSDYLKEVQ